MIAGKLNATVECNPLLGPQFFELALKVVNGEPVPKRYSARRRFLPRQRQGYLADAQVLTDRMIFNFYRKKSAFQPEGLLLARASKYKSQHLSKETALTLIRLSYRVYMKLVRISSGGNTHRQTTPIQ